MARQYNVVDADGHILEPLNLWLDYIEPTYRDRAPRLVTNNHGRRECIGPFAPLRVADGAIFTHDSCLGAHVDGARRHGWLWHLARAAHGQASCPCHPG